MISALSQLKMKYQNFTTKWYLEIFLSIIFYQHKLNIPFENDPLYPLNGTMVGYFALYSNSDMLMSLQKSWISYAFKLVLVMWKLFSTGNDKTDKLINNKGNKKMERFWWKHFLLFDPKWSHIPNDADTLLKEKRKLDPPK